MRLDPQARTTLAFIAMPDVNTPEFVFYRNPGADIRLRPDELDRQLLQTTRAFQCGGLNLTDEPMRGATHAALHLARASGALISSTRITGPRCGGTRQKPANKSWRSCRRSTS